MRVMMQTRYGPPEVVGPGELPTPVPKANELLVRVRATTVNRTDCGFRSASPFIVRFFSGLVRPKRPVLGNEFGGDVEAVGPSVEPFRVGDRVFGFDGVGFGCHAQYKVVRADGMVATIPDGLTFEEAAPIAEGAHYALHYIRAARIGRGTRVLLNGASGGIGSAALQICRHIGASVTAVCGTKNVDRVRALGAARVIDYQREDFTRAAADDAPYDVVLDAVGKSSLGRCRHLLGPRGVYTSTELGPGAQNPFLALVAPFSRGRKVLFPIPTDRREDVLHLRALVAAGAFRPLIDRVCPWTEIVAAYRFVETGEKTGNVVLTVD